MTSVSPSARRRALPPGYRIGRAIGTALMALCAGLTAVPLVIMLFNGLKSDGEFLRNPVGPPRSIQWGNISEAWNAANAGAPLSHAFLNSVVVTVGTVVIVTVVACLAAYALGTFQFKGERLVTLAVLILVAVPTQATLIPVFRMMGDLDLRNSYLGLILLYGAFWMPFSILLLRAAFRSFPKELIEAARIDGAGEIVTLVRVVIPILRNQIAGVAVVNAIGIWSELLFSYLIMNKPEFRTLPSAIVAFQGQFVTNYHLLYAALLIAVLPVLAFYALLSSTIRKGISAGSLR